MHIRLVGLVQGLKLFMTESFCNLYGQNEWEKKMLPEQMMMKSEWSDIATSYSNMHKQHIHQMQVLK